MVTFACNGDAPSYDAALASFAAHHLAAPGEKGRFLAGVRRQLKPGGTFYVVDSFRHPGVRRKCCPTCV